MVDNGSTDSTREMLETLSGVEVLALEENQGFARAVNRGILHCSSDFVALLNNDTEVDPGWVEAGLAAFDRNPSYWFLASRMMDYRQRNRIDSAGDGYDRTGMPFKRGRGDPCELHSRSRPVLGASAGAAFYRRELFRRIGLFDEKYYMYLEDGGPEFEGPAHRPSLPLRSGGRGLPHRGRVRSLQGGPGSRPPSAGRGGTPELSVC